MIDDSWYQHREGVPEIPAAGGVVVRRESGRVLVAFAQEMEFSEYVLPKGHVDPGETPEQAARREIEEEVGISDLRLVEFLGVRMRLSFDKTEWKTTHYFLYRTAQDEAVPTDAEHHLEMRWFPLDDLPDMFWPEQRLLLDENRHRIALLTQADA